MNGSEGSLVPLPALAAMVPEGALVALPPDYAGVAMALTRAIVRKGPRNLRLVAVPQSGLQADLLIGAGLVDEVEAAAITLNEHGAAPCFTRAVREGAFRLKDATCPAIHAGLQASEKGIPFMPLRGLIGSDLMRVRPEWRVADNPFGNDDPIALLPAIRPDVALFHVPLADRAGNVWIGRRRELATMAHAAAATLVTAERVQDADLFDDPLLAAGALSALYVTAVAEAPRGAWPLAFENLYPADAAQIAAYVRAAATPEGLAAWLAENVLKEGSP